MGVDRSTVKLPSLEEVEIAQSGSEELKQHSPGTMLSTCALLAPGLCCEHVQVFTKLG